VALTTLIVGISEVSGSGSTGLGPIPTGSLEAALLLHALEIAMPATSASDKQTDFIVASSLESSKKHAHTRPIHGACGWQRS
jgi:hypothetical protein